MHPAAVRSRKGLRGTSGSSSFLLALWVPPSDQVRLAGSFGSFGPGHEGSTLPSGTSFFQLTPISLTSLTGKKEQDRQDPGEEISLKQVINQSFL